MCLRFVLEREANLSVIGEAANGREAVEQALELKPELVLMDIAMPELNGIEATRQILAKSPQVKVLALTMYRLDRQVQDMLKAGASGYVLKDCTLDELLLAIRTVADSKTYLTPEIAHILVADYRNGGSGNGGANGHEEVDAAGAGNGKGTAVLASCDLTTREREVLQMVAEGQATKNIATALKLSVKTIESHRQSLMKKLDLHSIASLTKYAVREGITTLDL